MQSDPKFVEEKLEELVILAEEASAVIRDFLEDEETFDTTTDRFKRELLDFYRTFAPLLLNAQYFRRKFALLDRLRKLDGIRGGGKGKEPECSSSSSSSGPL